MADSKHADTTWHKGTASAASGNCVEVAVVDESVLVRDSRYPLGPILSFSREGWVAFVEDMTNGEFTVDQTSNYTL